MLHRIITFIIVGGFTLSGIMMLSPVISLEIHSQMKSDFHSYYRVNPLVERKVIQSDADTYRHIIGITELICVALILIGPYSLLRLAYIVLAILMMGALYTHYRLQHELTKCAPAGVLLSLILFQLFGYRSRNVHVHFD